jgi:hypothetical protein
MLNLLNYDPFRNDLGHFEHFAERTRFESCLGCPDKGKDIEEDEQRLDYLARFVVPDSRAEAVRFLSTLDPDVSYFTFQTFDDDAERKDGKLARVLNGTLDQHWNTLCNLNRKGAGVYVTVCETDGKGRTKENITRVRALFTDLDGAPLEPVWQSTPKPHIVVKSSPGKFHCYWLVEDVALEQFESLQKVLAARFGGDPKVSDLPRVLRLPGFYHRKGEPYKSHIVRLHKAPAYRIADFGLPEMKANGVNDKNFERFSDDTKSPTQKLNDAALRNLAAWVPQLFPEAKPYHDGFRVSSADLGRNLQEDISLVSTGIVDFGVADQGDPREGKRTPVELVMEHYLRVPIKDIAERNNPDEFTEACDWLRKQLGDDDEEDEQENEDKLLAAKPYDFPAEEALERYDWLLGRHLLRDEVAGSAAMGGTGKSSLSIVEALAMASGKQLTHDTVPREPLRVVLINLEDRRNTMDKRIRAAMKHHGVTKEDIGDRLFVFAKGEISFKIATERNGKVERNEKVIDALTKFMIEKRADVLSIDSFIRAHAVNENSNVPIEQVIECFEEIAVGARCCVHLWHHTRKGKGDGDGISVEATRGAQSFIDACRSVRVLETMSKADARKLGVEDEKNYRRYFRVFSGKRNFAPHIENSDWFYIAGVNLNNVPAGSLMDGDSIGVVETWTAGEAQKAAALSPEIIGKIKQAVADSEWREDVRASMWVGKAVAPLLGLDPDDDQEEVKRRIKQLIKDGVLKTIPGRKEDRKPCLFIVSGDWKAPVIKLAKRQKQKGSAPTEANVCGVCGGKIKSRRKDARFCSNKCRLKAHRNDQDE